MFENEHKLFEENVFHDANVLLQFPTVNDQLPFRKKLIMEFIQENNIVLSDVDAFVGRGGNCYSVSSGVYIVDERLIADTRAQKGGMEHPSNLGVQLARELQKEYGGQAFMLDPISMDELGDLARMTGIRGVIRHTNIHALNLRGTAMMHTHRIGKKYHDCNFIVCHIDGGISVSAHQKGRIIDCNDAGGGDGPYTPRRIGSVSAADMIEYCRGSDLDEVKKLVSRTGCFVSHFGTSDSDKVHKMMEDGSKKAELVWNGMVYQIIKYICAMATVLSGQVDGIVLTGRLLRFPDIEEKIREQCGWIAPVTAYCGV